MRSSPGDLSHQLPEIPPTPVAPALAAASAAASAWAATPFEERAARLEHAAESLRPAQDELATLIALETGKPITEARAELAAVLAKVPLSLSDARRHLPDQPVTDTPQPALLRQRPRGPALVIGPFNFPLHLPHGAIVPHLLAGNPVLFKPSPHAPQSAARYAEILSASLPPGLLTLVQGGAAEAQELALAPSVTSIHFTGSLPVGLHLAALLAPHPQKDLALELGGKNPAIICPDADLPLAAQAIAQAACLTTGQRCNATSRVIVHQSVSEQFTGLLLHALDHWSRPGHPLRPETLLGPLVSESALARYAAYLTEEPDGEWLLPGEIPGEIPHPDHPSDPDATLQGHYVTPALIRFPTPEATLASLIHRDEIFAPLLTLTPVPDLDAALSLANSTPYGLSASIFTRSRQTFLRLADHLRFANLLANLPTTHSPSALPFGGWGHSGNRHPAGRNFIQHTTDQQTLQIAHLHEKDEG